MSIPNILDRETQWYTTVAVLRRVLPFHRRPRLYESAGGGRLEGQGAAKGFL
ncbi:MAG: hypothetical protein IJ154_02085 [Bacteroidales bacterium]|nr:hypothetical protein [Bacteroidales bacterium]